MISIFIHPEYSESNAIFCKVDVDKANQVAKAMGITSMPSFKIIKNGVEVCIYMYMYMYTHLYIYMYRYLRRYTYICIYLYAKNL
jgi:hypothetical protein